MKTLWMEVADATREVMAALNDADIRVIAVSAARDDYVGEVHVHVDVHPDAVVRWARQVRWPLEHEGTWWEATSGEFKGCVMHLHRADRARLAWGTRP